MSDYGLREYWASRKRIRRYRRFDAERHAAGIPGRFRVTVTLTADGALVAQRAAEELARDLAALPGCDDVFVETIARMDDDA